MVLCLGASTSLWANPCLPQWEACCAICGQTPASPSGRHLGARTGKLMVLCLGASTPLHSCKHSLHAVLCGQTPASPSGRHLGARTGKLMVLCLGASTSLCANTSTPQWEACCAICGQSPASPSGSHERRCGSFRSPVFEHRLFKLSLTTFAATTQQRALFSVQCCAACSCSITRWARGLSSKANTCKQ